jgi:hypothetical protein
MGFVQIIEYRTSKIDEMRKVGEEWEQADGPPTFHNLDVVEDRN